MAGGEDNYGIRPADRQSRRIGKFLVGTKVKALTDEVRTVAGRFVVKNRMGSIGRETLFGFIHISVKEYLRFGSKEKCRKKI